MLDMMPPKFKKFIASAILLEMVLCSANAYTDHFYKAALFEHALLGDWTTDTAEDILKRNLDFFKNAAREAKSKNADIIIFPEYGLFPFDDREHMKKVLERVPNPKEVRANPCKEPEQYLNRPILLTLSCIARNNSMVLVANTGDIQPCENETGCPDDGVYHYNANVAFDSDGTLIGRYHKEHLFFEAGMDLPKERQDPTFETKFGTFAMFVCFDIIFKRITEIAKLDVEAILLPTMWIDPTPMMSSVQLWQAWAMENNITFMAANIQRPGYLAVGSGIFNGHNGPLAYTYNPDGLSKLVVAKVPRRQHRTQFNDSEASIVTITINGTEEYTNDGSKVPTVCSRKILGETTDMYTDYRCLEEDTSNYTFTKLEGISGKIDVCNNGLCCSLDYEANEMRENYYLGVYNGTYNMFDRYFWCEENCLLVRCEPFGENPCATFPMRSSTKFYRVHLSTNITAEYLYPSVLGSGIRLEPISQWRYGKEENNAFVNFENSSGKELLVVGLNGRCYDKDPPYIR